MMRKVINALTCAIAALTLTATAHAQSSATIKAIKDSGVLRVAMADSPPAQVKSPATDEWEGYNVEMAEDLARVLAVELEIVDGAWSTLIPGLMADKYDICMVDMYATPERAQTVVFTDAYNILGYSFIVQEDSPYQRWEDLNKAGVVISTLSGTASEPFIEQYLPEAEMRSMVTENVYAPHLEVANKRADAHVTDEVSNVLFIENNPDFEVRILPDLVNATGLAYAIRPGDSHFHSFLNTWIRYKIDSGHAGQLRKKWYGY
jgi:ABC-type amino acid transport substrate-binding protein